MEQVAEQVAEQIKALDLGRGTGEQIKKHYLVWVFNGCYFKTFDYYLFFSEHFIGKLSVLLFPSLNLGLKSVPLPVPHLFHLFRFLFHPIQEIHFKKEKKCK